MAAGSNGQESEEGRPQRRGYPQHEQLYGELREPFGDGFDMLAKHPQVEPRIVTITENGDPGGGNFVFISLGIINVGRFAEYNHEYAEVFIRLPATFPAGQKYGFATDPALEVDGELPDNSEMERDHAEPLCRELDIDQILYWSRNWNYMDIDEQGSAEQMRQAVPWMKQVLSTPVEGDS